MNPIDFAALAAPFPADAIEWRVGSRTKKGDRATLLAYLTSRAVMQRLDELVGPERWRDSYAPVLEGGKVAGYICTLELEVREGQWVAKSDGADVTDMEGFKGGISSALKRAAVKWGIGRYLYDLGTSWHPIREGYGPDGTSVPCPFGPLGPGGPKDAPPGHVMVPKLPAWALPTPPAPKAAKAKKTEIDTTPTAADQAAADEVEAARRQAAAQEADAKAARERAEAARKAKHHPSWEGAEQRKFFAVCGELEMNGDLACDLIERVSKESLRPSAMNPAQRAGAILWLQGPNGRSAYNALVTERERLPDPDVAASGGAR